MRRKLQILTATVDNQNPNKTAYLLATISNKNPKINTKQL